MHNFKYLYTGFEEKNNIRKLGKYNEWVGGYRRKLTSQIFKL